MNADPLVSSLLFVARNAGRPTSAEAVVRGLPLDGGRLPWAALAEAGRNAGLAVQPVEALDPAAITPFVLPIVAQRKAGGAIVITRRRDDALCVVDAAAADGEGRWLAPAALAAELAGPAAHVAPVEFHDGRSLDGAAEGGADWFWGVVRLNAPLYATAVAASLLINVVGALAVFYVMAVYDRVIPNRAMDTLAVITAGVLLLYAADLAFKLVRAKLIDAAARRFDMLAGSRIFAAVLGLPPTARPTSVGTLSATIREFESLREFFAAATLTVVGDLPFVLVLIGTMAWVAGGVAWVPIVTIPLMLAMGAGVALASRRLTRTGHKEGLVRQAMLHEFATGLDTLQAQGGEAWARRRWERMLGQAAETAEKTRGVAHLGVHGIGFVQSVAMVGVVALAATLVSDGKLSTGALAACSILVGRALAPLGQLAQLTLRYQNAKDAYDALHKLLAAAEAPAAPGARIHLPRIEGALACRDVGFAYPAAGEIPAVPVLDGVGFAIAPGEHVAILGPVGSGKSTLLNLIAGLNAPSAGHVQVDGVDNRLVSKPDLHAQLGYAPQFPMLFAGTVRENVVLGHPGASDDEVRAALAIAGLDALLATSAEGLGMQVGEGGRRLSGGTRQAVALARAVLTNPPVLLLDEPTSMIDTTSEKAILARLAEARRGKTLVVVTHRPALLALVDRIVVLDRGRVVADGPRDEVLSQLRS